MQISDRMFAALSGTFHKMSGIRLETSKRQMVIGRLQRLAGEKGFGDLDDYLNQVFRGGDSSELMRVVDRLTTNETYFFREPAHFEFLSQWLKQRPRTAAMLPFRVWSAASSSGEEAYSVAMVLADCLGPVGWDIVGTDLSATMIDNARRGLYLMERARLIPQSYLKRFCLKGQGPHDGQLLVDKSLRSHVHFVQANLTHDLPDIGMFDLVFLRNVLIYFEAEAKMDIVCRVMERIRPGGYLFTGHSESLSRLPEGLVHIQPAIYARA